MVEWPRGQRTARSQRCLTWYLRAWARREDKVIAAAAGAFHSAAVTASGALWIRGLVGRGGRLGLGDERRRLVPTRVANVLLMCC